MMSELEKLEFLGKRQLSRENQEIAKDKEKVERGVKMEESMKGLPSIGMQHAERPIIRTSQNLVGGIKERAIMATENYRNSGIKLPSMMSGNFDIGVKEIGNTGKELKELGTFKMPNISIPNMNANIDGINFNRHKTHKKTKHYRRKYKADNGLLL